VRENVAWDVGVAADLAETEPPTEDELRIMREDLDPAGHYRM
jgi:glutaconate CoA-transferase subunit B